MPKPIIAIAVDIFSPAAYRAAEWPAHLGAAPGFVEDYAHERDYVYVALQPMLFRTDAVNAVGFPVDVLPRADSYFALGTRLAASDVTWASQDLQARMTPAIEAVPAALPPGTVISLDLCLSDGTVAWSSGERRIGQTAAAAVTSPLLLDIARWPDVAALNFSHPTASSFGELGAAQREELYVWLGAALVDLVRAHTDGKNLTPAQSAALGRFSGNLPGTPGEMRSQLVANNLGADIYAILLGETKPLAQQDVPLSTPRFRITDAAAFAARIRSEIALPAGHTQASYLHVWWQNMAGEARKEASQSWGDLSLESPLASALGRYFGFGERLRWPMSGLDFAGAANEYFMVPRLQSPGLASMFETNAASLCELVFRIPVARIAGAGAGLHATISVAGQILDDTVRLPSERLGPRIAEMIDAGLDWFDNRRCRARMELDEVDESGNALPDRNGLVLIQPRIAQCTRVTGALQGLEVFSVPGALLDLVDDSARTALNEDGEGLSVTGIPRRALFPEECHRLSDALAGGSPAWRIRVELQPAAISKPGASSAQVHEIIAAKLSNALVSGLANGATSSEAERYAAILPELFTANGRYRATLWIPQQGGAARQFLAENLLFDADGPNEHLRFYIRDEDPAQGIGAALQGAASGRSSVTVDLIIEANPGGPDPRAAIAAMPFNLILAAPGHVPWIALQRAALSRVGRSVDRWLERFHVTPEVSPRPPAREPCLDHLGNFNKLRIFARSAQGSDTAVPVTYPDAAIPLRRAPPGTRYAETLPWEFGRPLSMAGECFSYFIGHLYSQESRTERPGNTQADTSLDRDPEAERYKRFERSRKEDLLTGYLEHQYSYRIPITISALVDARVATDVRNPGGLVARLEGETRTDGSIEESPPAPLLEFSLTDSSRSLLFTARAAYFRAALAGDRKAGAIQPDGRADHVDALRAIYETAFDFVHAIDSGNAELIAELWEFDNSLPRSGARVTNQDLPSRFRRLATGTLVLRSGGHAGAELRAAFASLVSADFLGFKTGVEALAARAIDADVFPPIRISFANAEWRWLDASGGARGAPDVHAEANLVQIRLRVQREPEQVVSPQIADGRYIALTRDQASALPAWLDLDLQDIHANAKAELQRLVRRPGAGIPVSGLYFREDKLQARPPEPDDVVVIEPAPPGGQSPKPITEPRASRFRTLFGEFARTLVVPEGAMLPVARVVEMFYVPCGYLPLDIHPALDDANATTDFTSFLTEMLSDVLDGRPVASMPTRARVPGEGAREAIVARLRAEHLARSPGGIAERLTALLRPVHNDKELRALNDTLVRRLIRLLDDAEIAVTPAALSSLLGMKPNLFARARAIGLCLFDPARFSTELQSVQICKQIEDRASATEEPIRDVDRFVIPPGPVGQPRLLLDPLETGRYDAEFTLAMNTYTGFADTDPPSHIYHSPIVLGASRAIKSRGGIAGRTGEDFIESRHHFPVIDDNAPVPRAIEIDAPHWNPHWAYLADPQTREVKRLYLLPSRRFPSAPVLLQVARGDGTKASVSPIAWNPGITGTADDVFKNTLKAALKPLNEGGLVVRSDDTQVDKNAVRWDFDDKAFAAVTAAHAEGWYRVDTFLEHHYFLVEAGEDQLHDPFANDLFRIDVRVRSDAHVSSVKSLVAPTASATRRNSNLLMAFRQWQRKAAGLPPEGGQDSVPQAISLPELVESIGHWLCAGADLQKVPPDEVAARGKQHLLQHTENVEPQEDGDFLADYVCSYTQESRITPKKAPAQPGFSERIGSVVAVAMFKSAALAVPVRRIMRVTVLADPWSHIRVRARQIRNQRDIQEDASDIDPAFAMPSEYSGWSAYSHPEILASDNLEHLPSERRIDIVSVGLREWIAKRLGPNPPDCGEPIRKRLQSVVPSGPYKGRNLWNIDEMLADTREISMVLRQLQPDRHRVHDGLSWGSVRARDMSVPRHVFGVTPAKHADANFQAAAGRAVTAGVTELEITWLDRATSSPVFRATWPIVFASV